MASSGVSGFGTLLNWDTADLVELTSITGPTETMDPIDISNHDSPDTYREFVAGLRNGGDITLEGNFIKGDATGQIAMHTDFQAGSVKAWIIKMPGWASAPQIAGNGYITAFSMSYPFDGKISLSVTIKVTGKPTLTPA